MVSTPSSMPTRTPSPRVPMVVLPPQIMSTPGLPSTKPAFGTQNPISGIESELQNLLIKDTPTVKEHSDPQTLNVDPRTRARVRRPPHRVPSPAAMEPPQQRPVMPARPPSWTGNLLRNQHRTRPSGRPAYVPSADSPQSSPASMIPTQLEPSNFLCGFDGPPPVVRAPRLSFSSVSSADERSGHAPYTPPSKNDAFNGYPPVTSVSPTVMQWPFSAPALNGHGNWDDPTNTNSRATVTPAVFPVSVSAAGTYQPFSAPPFSDYGAWDDCTKINTRANASRTKYTSSSSAARTYEPLSSPTERSFGPLKSKQDTGLGQAPPESWYLPGRPKGRDSRSPSPIVHSQAPSPYLPTCSPSLSPVQAGPSGPYGYEPFAPYPAVAPPRVYSPYSSPYGWPTRHPKFWFADANLTFIVEDTEYRVHRFFFEEHSAHFKELLATPIYAHSATIPLFVSKVDFERLLSVFYPSSYISDPLSALETVEELSSVLGLVTQWKFKALRERTIDVLEEKATPVERIKLGHEHNIKGWTAQAYAELCTRGRPVSLDEAKQLGLKVVLKIWQVETELRENGACVGPCCKERILEVVKSRFNLG